MLEPHEIEAIKASVDIVAAISKHVTLTQKGKEYVGICPFHNEKTKSFNVNPVKGIFKCFGCGKGGDVIDFLVQKGYSFQDAIAELTGDTSVFKSDEAVKISKADQAPIWTQVFETRGVPNFNHYLNGEPSNIWTYHNKDGNIIGHVCRFDMPGGGKEVVPMVYATNGKRHEWRWLGFSAPRPLYNLHLIHANPDATIFVVEGEKTAGAAQQLFPRAIITTWIGGARAVAKTDWTPLKDRKVFGWPDNDIHGFNAMNEAKELAHAESFRFILPPDSAPEHWDIADADWDEPQARKHFGSSIIDVLEWKEPGLPVVFEVAEIIEEVPPFIPNEPPAMPEILEEVDEDAPFICMGFEKDDGKQTFCFYVKESKILVKIPSSGISMSSLITLAPLNYWEMNYPTSKGKFDMAAANNHLVRICNQIGIFNSDLIRGRGAWMEGSIPVIHAGTHIITKSGKVKLADYKTPYIYEQGVDLGFKMQKPLNKEESNKIIQMMDLLNWERDINSYLLAGWCVVAPVCGALPWRPHIWLTGSAGTGKSWVFKELVRVLLGKTALAVQGETSEAGLRQTLQHDALPVVFDEAEGEDERSRSKMDDVMGLMRSSSAEDGGMMVKGSSTGSSKTYRIRSCFAFSSIVIGVKHQSDRGRVTILSLVEHPVQHIKEEKWEKLQKLHAETITEEYVARLQSRTISLLPIILQNSKIFAKAAAAEIGMQRAGDQLGALLAGAYSLFSDSLINYETAIEWVKSKDWSEERSLDKSRDEAACFSHLMEQITRVDGFNTVVERNIGELVSLINHMSEDLQIDSMAAVLRLHRLGIKVEDGFVIISNTSEWVRRTLEKTAWSKNHNKILLRIPGATTVESTRFGSGVKSRAVKIPLNFM